MTTQTTLFTFIHNLAITGIDQNTAIEVILNGFNIDLNTLNSELPMITEQAFAGLNPEAGQWCKELMLSTINKMF